MSVARSAVQRLNRTNGLCWCGRTPVPGFKACEMCRGIQQRRRERLRSAGNCTSCGHQAAPNKTKCQDCLDSFRDTHAAYRLSALTAYGLACGGCGTDTREFLTIDHVKDDGAAHRRSIKGNLYRWLAANNYPEGFQTLCWNCNSLKYNLRARDTKYSEYSQRIRLDTIKAYGGECVCCSIADPAILVIDHLNGGGVAHRKELKRSGSKFCLWLQRSDYPSGYRVLCHNCNNSIAAYGSCPHTHKE